MTTTEFDPDSLRAKYEFERDKRLRAEGNDQYIDISDFDQYLEDPYVQPLNREPLFDEVEVAVIGGGFGGLLAGARLREAGVTDIRMIEKGGDFGGTWYWNRYPGAACDVESYIYLPLLEEIGYIPKQKYSNAPEILEHSRAIARFFDPYSVGAQGTLNLMSELGFGQFSPAAQFLMMPLYEDVLRMQQIEFNDHIRKSAHTFNIVDNKLEIFPIPTANTLGRVYFEYMSRDEFEHDSQTIQSDSLSDYSDIPYDFIQYSYINDVGKQWIRKYTLALSKELLGAIREKYSSVPIPDGEVNLDGAALRAEAQVEKDMLMTQLRENLEEMSRKNVMENKTHESNHHQEMLRKVPLKLYVG